VARFDLALKTAFHRLVAAVFNRDNRNYLVFGVGIVFRFLRWRLQKKLECVSYTYQSPQQKTGALNMSPAEQAVISALSAEAKAALKALLLDIVDKEIPAIAAAETAKLPDAYGPVVNMVFQASYPALAKMIDEKIAAI
jgi:hypothetical protein